MKKISFLFSFVLLLFFAGAVRAQSNDTYFVGKWDILVVGLPQGDTEAIVKFEIKDGKLTGTITEKAVKNMAVFKTVELKDSTVSVRFDHTSGEVEMSLVKKDENNLTGLVASTFDVTGVRQKED